MNNSIEIRDQREQEWYWTNNEFVDHYGEIVGTHAVAVYSVLCRHANNDTQKCFPSMETIGRKAGIKSRKTVSKAIEILAKLHIIEVETATGPDGKRLNNIYHLMKPSAWKGSHITAEVGFKVIADLKDVPKDSILMEVSLKEAHKKAAELDHAAFPWLDLQAWHTWEEYRKQKKQKLTPLSIKKQLAFLEQHKGEHVDIINRSIMNGWTGLFPLRKDYQKPSPQKVEAAVGKYSHLSS